jgi:hypothetical protein
LPRLIFAALFIESECELINVAAKVLLAGVMVDADQAAFHDREYALDAIGGHAVASVFAFAVVDTLVAEEQSAHRVIYRRFVGVQH